jgi:predicted membrane chloride channel (bestrophin family)
MGVKSGFVIGFGVGYVLGSKAGRERYEDIRRWWGQLSSSPAVHSAADRTKAVAADASRRGLQVVQSGVEKAGSAVRTRLHKEDSTDRLVDRLETNSGKGPRRGPDTATDAFRGSTGT